MIQNNAKTAKGGQKKKNKTENLINKNIVFQRNILISRPN